MIDTVRERLEQQLATSDYFQQSYLAAAVLDGLRLLDPETPSWIWLSGERLPQQRAALRQLGLTPQAVEQWEHLVSLGVRRALNEDTGYPRLQALGKFVLQRLSERGQQLPTYVYSETERELLAHTEYDQLSEAEQLRVVGLMLLDRGFRTLVADGRLHPVARSGVSDLVEGTGMTHTEAVKLREAWEQYAAATAAGRAQAELERQIAALEHEITDKQAQLETLRAGR